jgi:hypothetical protein
LFPLLLLATTSGCFWHRWTRKAEYARAAAVQPLDCQESLIIVDNLPDGFRATGCGKYTWCSDESGDWRCLPGTPVVEGQPLPSQPPPAGPPPPPPVAPPPAP